jgi:peptidoglycan/xylan/chitin deacetylase (PgdA/CDA1 family)
MQVSRRDFLQKIGLSALGWVPGAAAMRALAEEPVTAPKVDDMEVRKAIAVPIEYEVNAHFANHGPGFGRRIAITFDDGPAPTTPLVLAELQKRNLKATFFMLGQMVKSYPDIAKQVLAAGHEIGNHSYTHPQLGKMPQAAVEQELQSCQDMVAQTLNGYTPVWFRPPYGSFRKDQGSIALAKQLGVITWSVDPNDWRKPGVNVVVDRVLTETRPGSVILLHDIHKTTCDAVPAILDGLLERGYEFTTISGFLGAPYEVS